MRGHYLFVLFYCIYGASFSLFAGKSQKEKKIFCISIVQWMINNKSEE